MDLFSVEPLSSLLIPPAEATLHNYYAHHDLPAAAEVCKSTDYWDAAEAEETLLFPVFSALLVFIKVNNPHTLSSRSFLELSEKGLGKQEIIS